MSLNVEQGVQKALLLAAKKLFARKGLTGTSIRDIAHEAGVNSSMISYYFKSKKGLYRFCLQEIATTRLNFVQKLLEPPMSLAEFQIRLKIFAENFFQLFLEDRDLGLIIIREYDRMNSPAEKVFKQSFLGIIESIIHFFSLAQSQQLINNQSDPFILGQIFFSSLTGQLRMDHITEKAYGKSIRSNELRNQFIIHLVNMMS